MEPIKLVDEQLLFKNRLRKRLYIIIRDISCGIRTDFNKFTSYDSDVENIYYFNTFTYRYLVLYKLYTFIRPSAQSTSM